MSKTVEQIFLTNPTTVVADTDLYYLVQSPYTPGSDAAITGASLKAAFGTGGTINPGLINELGYYATSGSTISGLTTANNGVLITSAGGAPSISSTLPSAVQGNITSLGTITSGIWHGSIITGTYGGTGINNGASTITIGGSVSFVGAFTFAGTLTGNTTVTFPTTGTLATTSQLLISPLTTKGDIWVWSTTNDRLPVGATNGQVLQVNSAAATGLSYSTATYPSTATNAARILRSNGTNWVESTSTFADTYAASSVLYANGANNVAGLTTANNGLLVTSNTGVPSILAGPGTTGNILQSNAAAAPSFSTATYPSTTTINQLLYSSAANVVAGLATANSAFLKTNGSGVPAFTTVLGAILNIQAFTAGSTYTPTTGTNFAIAIVIGAGGGSTGSGTTAGTASGNGGTSSIGSIVSASGGNGGAVNSSGSSATPGVGSGGTLNLTGQPGTPGGLVTGVVGIQTVGPIGGAAPFIGISGVSSVSTNTPSAPSANTGAGAGAPGPGTSNRSGNSGAGGGAALYFWTTPSSQTITIGTGGTAGGAGSSGSAGAAGANGLVIIIEFA